MNGLAENKLFCSPKLSGRLSVIASMVDPGTPFVADIGTDHAYLPIWLVGNKICSKAVASDIRQGPAERARQNIESFGLSDRIAINKGDGLSNIELTSEDQVIIAGMGGLEIQRIIDSALLPQNITMILQPQRSIPELRAWLINNGFHFIDEAIVHDRDHFYTVIKVVLKKRAGNQSALSLSDCWLGPVLINKFYNSGFTEDEAAVWYGYLSYLKSKISRIVIGSPELKDVLVKISGLLSGG
jgi:tRNA (adenine22-N1)-methyltransferase